MGSELAEASSLLSLAMPAANVNFLSREDGDVEAAVAIEVRPRRRLFTAVAGDDAVPEMGKIIYSDHFQKKQLIQNGSKYRLTK